MHSYVIQLSGYHCLHMDLGPGLTDLLKLICYSPPSAHTYFIINIECLPLQIQNAESEEALNEVVYKDDGIQVLLVQAGFVNKLVRLNNRQSMPVNYAPCCV